MVMMRRRDSRFMPLKVSIHTKNTHTCSYSSKVMVVDKPNNRLDLDHLCDISLMDDGVLFQRKQNERILQCESKHERVDYTQHE
jgi:hypothetical protein